MESTIALSGLNDKELLSEITELVRRHRPRLVAVASAFVSVQGIVHLGNLVKSKQNTEFRLIAGTDHFITHPSALSKAKDAGWKLRIGPKGRGIFHAKLLVTGDGANRRGNIEAPSCTYIGSSNTTERGFRLNVECGLLSTDPLVCRQAATAFATLWRTSTEPSESFLKNYAARFAQRNRRRPLEDLISLGIDDARDTAIGTRAVTRKVQQPQRSSFGSDFAVCAWAGLEVFTGGWRFQPEFPDGAGLVASNLIKGYVKPNGKIDVECEDGDVREMKFVFRQDNGMFRLDVPNDTPGVKWAREHKKGLALIERGAEGGVPIRFTIVPPSTKADETVKRSETLGNLGSTNRRLYGWY